MASLILKIGNYLTIMAEACVSGVGLGGVSITIQNYFNVISERSTFLDILSRCLCFDLFYIFFTCCVFGSRVAVEIQLGKVTANLFHSFLFLFLFNCDPLGCVEATYHIYL